ncbi:PepSY domain-containing protein [Thalassovita mangrovi]|uniref:PepSY domain-containing protein n=1 Tax=Thalassovita mangrovi TaxID=2692236 RepID=A0A6L8LE72_9RHOB|nr:PepSY domain-containing protein [Thalassovita mangrovi]MYM54357.1 PepSY domain-containing protein [Thalassovita mangrovi]
MTGSIKAVGFGLVLALAGMPALASGEGVMLNQETRAKIVEKMTGEGYEVRKVKTEDGYYEVYALKDGKKLEIYLDADLNPVRTKGDD